MVSKQRIPFQFVERKAGFRIIAGKPIDIKAALSKDIARSAKVPLTYIQPTGQVGTHGVIDFSVKPARHMLLWIIPKYIMNHELRFRLLDAIAGEELVGHIEGRGVPLEYQSQPGQSAGEKLNIGKRLWGRAIRHLRKQGVKLVFASTQHDNALKSQLDMGMQVLYHDPSGFFITAMPLDRRPPKERRAVLLTRGQPR